MNTETNKMLRCVRKSLREGIRVFSPFWGVDSCFELGRVHNQPR